MNRIVMTYGTFDMFHIGHLNLLRQAREFGDYLVVFVSTDEFNRKKGKKCIIPFEQRRDIVRCIKGVDLVMSEENWEQKLRDIRDFSRMGEVTIVMGSDWDGNERFTKLPCKTVFVPRTSYISTSKIKEVIRNEV